MFGSRRREAEERAEREREREREGRLREQERAERAEKRAERSESALADMKQRFDPRPVARREIPTGFETNRRRH